MQPPSRTKIHTSKPSDRLQRLEEEGEVDNIVAYTGSAIR